MLNDYSAIVALQDQRFSPSRRPARRSYIYGSHLHRAEACSLPISVSHRSIDVHVLRIFIWVDNDLRFGSRMDGQEGLLREALLPHGINRKDGSECWKIEYWGEWGDDRVRPEVVV